MKLEDQSKQLKDIKIDLKNLEYEINGIEKEKHFSTINEALECLKTYHEFVKF